ncbi:MAG: DNA gyrase/topoisomerase IV subunit A [Bacteroidota bacterium]|nr:DNA gyrase/topoisomerase IV subunit A [Bacteroidota bacterium]
MKEEKKAQNKITQNGNSLAPISALYKDWFLDYASYVILERAIPAIEDGLKPVQRRIFHAMKETDDGRFNKVANVIGNTMQYHPHGDASIGDAIINIGQKNLPIETQGNWGDIVTGDRAAAPRYIEARLSKFALEVAFNSETTEWQNSYDGRKKEPVTLPMKFPYLLAQGAEGIAVGLSTKVLPHNFIELLKSAINYLENKEFQILPDFPTGGMADFTNYNDGKKGGRVRVRSKIEIADKTTLAIKNVPFSVTTTSIIESIVKANENGKIKIKKVIDNTARDVEILVILPKGVSPDVTIDALYAFTNCEISISPNACVIVDDKPEFLGVTEILEISTDKTVSLLKKELEIQKENLLEKWHFASLEKIFIEKRIYREIEECETWEAVLEAIDKGLKPHVKHIKREITTDDIIRLTEIKIKRISKYNSFRADEIIENIENDLQKTESNLKHLIEFAIAYFQNLLKKYSKGRERKTEIREFDNIEAKNVAVANKKLYVNRKEGFFGFGLKKEEEIGECSELDDIITFRKDGKYSVRKVDDKIFSGKNILHIDVFNKEDERLTYNLIYFDSKSNRTMVKRFNVTSVTREKEYDATKGNPNSKILYLTPNPLGETEIVTIHLSPTCRARIKVFDFDFKDIDIKGRNSIGNILTKYPIRKIVQKSVDKTNIIGIDIWYDEYVGKLNTNENGKYLGNFKPNDQILAIYDNGSYELTDFALQNHYNFDKLFHIEKFVPERTITAIYYHGKQKQHYVKRFQIETTTTGRDFIFIAEDKGTKLNVVSTGSKTLIKYSYINEKNGGKKTKMLELSEEFEVMGWKAIGKKLSPFKVNSIKIVDIIYEEKLKENEGVEEQVEVQKEEVKNETPKKEIKSETQKKEQKEEKPESPKKEKSKKKKRRGKDSEQLSLF